MLTWLGRLVWWVLAYARPRGALDILAVVGLFALLCLGILALSWPWVTAEVARLSIEAGSALSAGARSLAEAVQRLAPRLE